MGQATEYSQYRFLQVERRENGVLLVTLNRPESLNAITYEMHRELSFIWDDIGEDDKTKIVVITGAGRAFSAGNDLKQPDPDMEHIFRLMRQALRINDAMTSLDKPIIAAVHGWAIGMGMQIAMMSDVVIAAEDAQFNDGHLRVGVVPGDHAIQIWPLLCGMAKAKYYLLTDTPITGKEAERLDMVALAVPRDEVLPRALALASTLAEGPQYALRWTKRALNSWLRQASIHLEHSVALEMIGYFAPDVAEGRLAFREGRKPVYPSSRPR